MTKYIFDLLKKNINQLLLIFVLLLQHKILISIVGLNFYGSYLLELSILTLLGALSFPGLNIYLNKGAIDGNDYSVIMYLRWSPVILIFGTIILIFISKLRLIENYPLFYFLGFVIYFFNSYDFVLLGKNKINFSRFLIIFQIIIFMTLVIIYRNNITIEKLLYFHLISFSIRNLLGWIKVFKISNFSFNNQYDIKPFFLQKNLGQLINPITSQIDKIVLGKTSELELALLSIYNVIPNNLKTNIKIFLINFKNNLIKNNNYYNDLKNRINEIYFLSLSGILFCFLITSTYFLFINEWSFSLLNLYIVLIISVSFVIKILNNIFWDYDNYIGNGKIYLITNFLSKTIYISMIFSLTEKYGIMGILISYITYDIINFFISFLNIYLKRKSKFYDK